MKQLGFADFPSPRKSLHLGRILMSRTYCSRFQSVAIRNSHCIVCCTDPKHQISSNHQFFVLALVPFWREIERQIEKEYIIFEKHWVAMRNCQIVTTWWWYNPLFILSSSLIWIRWPKMEPFTLRLDFTLQETKGTWTDQKDTCRDERAWRIQFLVSSHGSVLGPSLFYIHIVFYVDIGSIAIELPSPTCDSWFSSPETFLCFPMQFCLALRVLSLSANCHFLVVGFAGCLKSLTCQPWIPRLPNMAAMGRISQVFLGCFVQVGKLILFGFLETCTVTGVSNRNATDV